jgi:lambda repressor-like predicted transcriptional regulator
MTPEETRRLNIARTVTQTHTRVTDWMHAEGWTLRSLAEELGISPAGLRNYVTGYHSGRQSIKRPKAVPAHIWHAVRKLSRGAVTKAHWPVSG